MAWAWVKEPLVPGGILSPTLHRCRNGTSVKLENLPKFIEMRKLWSRDVKPRLSDSQPRVFNPFMCPKVKGAVGAVFILQAFNVPAHSWGLLLGLSRGRLEGLVW